MTSRHLAAACAALCLQAPFAHAQDADAQARAKRDADNPLRMIIEASKLKPRSKAPEPDAAAKPAAESKVAAKPPAAKPAPAVAAPAVAAPPAEQPERPTALASATPAAEPRAAAVDAAPTLTATPERQETPETPETPTVTSAKNEAPIDAAVPTPLPPSSPSTATLVAPTSAPTADTTTASATATASPTAATPAQPVALQLADYVEPVVPDRVKRRLQADGTVVLAFTVQPDGSVADIAVRSSTDRALDTVALEAVRQWRYQPIGVAQAHGVQLVFRLRE